MGQGGRLWWNVYVSHPQLLLSGVLPTLTLPLFGAGQQGSLGGLGEGEAV